MASSTAMNVAMIASWRLSAKRRRTSSRIDAPVHIEVPKSKRRMPPIHDANCFHIGWSRPSRARSLSRLSDRKSTRLNSSHDQISYAVFCLKKKNKKHKKLEHVPYV